MAAGSPFSHTSVSWDVSLGCLKPFEAVLASSPPIGFAAVQAVKEGDVRFISVLSPCRKCEPCRKARASEWRSRIKHEIAASPRSWMATFTINPHYRFMFSLKTGSRDFMDSHKSISAELTKYFKRLRKSGLKFRYVLVTEAHKDGYPHYHALIHEGFSQIPKSRLQAEWPYGFTQFKLVKDAKAAHYITKYLVKDARTRIRASGKYGQSALQLFGLLDGIPTEFQHPHALRHSFTKKNVYKDYKPNTTKKRECWVSN